MQTKKTLQALVDDCSYLDWNILLRYDTRLALGEDGEEDRPYIQIVFMGEDALTGKLEEQRCRKWMLSYHMVDGEVVATVYAAIERAVIHESREYFLYKGLRIYNPHGSLRALVEIAAKGLVDKREEV